MPANAFSQWRYDPPYGAESPGAPVYSGGPEPFFRSGTDADRSMYNAVPGADYPDGYLGTIHSRRGDRLLDRLKARQNQRSYQRGVHKGERIDQSDYFWPNEFNPMTSLRRQATTGERFAPPLAEAYPVLVNDGKTDRAGLAILSVDPARSQQMAHLRPRWK